MSKRTAKSYINPFARHVDPSVEAAADLKVRCRECNRKVHSPLPDGRCGACTFPPDRMAQRQMRGRLGR